MGGKVLLEEKRKRKKGKGCVEIISNNVSNRIYRSGKKQELK